MTKGEIVILIILAFIGYFLFRYVQANNIDVTGTMGTLNTPVDSGGAGNTAAQDMYGLAGMPITDYTQGPNFYVQNQPWYFQTPMGGVMPMTSASTNITGAPSAQNVNQPCSNC